MDRREFLKYLGLGAAAATVAAVAPKLIFDLGAKKYKDTLIWQPRLYFCGIDPGYENAEYEEVIIMGKDPYEIYLTPQKDPSYLLSDIRNIEFHKDEIVQLPLLYPRRFNLVNGTMKEVLPFAT